MIPAVAYTFELASRILASEVVQPEVSAAIDALVAHGVEPPTPDVARARALSFLDSLPDDREVWDEFLLEYLGRTDSAAAEAIRSAPRARSPWDYWYDPGWAVQAPRWLVWVVRTTPPEPAASAASRRAVVSSPPEPLPPEVAARRERTGTTALVRPVADRVARLTPHRKAGGTLVADGDVVLVPVLDASRLPDLGLAAVGSALGAAFLEWQARVLHGRYLRGDASMEVEIEGGYEALVAELGFSGHKRISELASLLPTLVGVRFSWDVPGSRGVTPLLWRVREVKARPGRKACLRLTLSGLFQPQFVHQLRKDGVECGRLVPVVDLPDTSRCGVEAARSASVGRLHRMGVLHLTVSSRQLVESGWVEIPWSALADHKLSDRVERVLQSPGWLDVWETDPSGTKWRLRATEANIPAIRFITEFKPKPRRGRQPRKSR